MFRVKYINLEYAGLTEMAFLVTFIQKFIPIEIYNFVSQSHLRVSFVQPIYISNVTGLGTLNLLEASRRVFVYQESLRNSKFCYK